MKYNKPLEKDKINEAWRVFLLMRGFKTLKDFCVSHGLDYNSVHQKLNSGLLDHDYMNELIHMVDPKFNLVQFQVPGQATKFQILKQN